MVLLEKAPDDVAISDICEGSVSVYSYAPIIPSFPWDLPDLRPSPESMGTKDSRFNHGVWGIRASLMRCLSPSLSSSPSSQSQSSQDSPLSTSYNFPSQVPTLNIFSAPAMDTPRRLQKRKLVSTRTSIPQAIDPCFAHEGDDQTPKSPPDNKQGFQVLSLLLLLNTWQSTEEDFHSPPNSHSTSRNVGPSLTETISPPSDRPSHDKANDSISPDIDRLVCLLDEEDELEKTKERSPEHNLRKKPRTSGEIVTLSLRKGKKEKQKTMTVASIKSYFR